MRLPFFSLLAAAPTALAACGGIAVLDVDPNGGSSSGTAPDPTTLGCDQGRADCNGAASDGCEIDLASDPGSCGACGHACQGGPCQSGLCQQVVVASGQTYVFHLAATETSLYWTRSDGSVLRLQAGGEPEILASGQSSPGDLAVDATSVYWANLGDGTIVRAPLGGGPTTIVVAGAGQPWSLAVTATTLSWTDNMTGEVRAMPLAGGAPVTVATTQGAWGVAADATRVYWTTLFQGSVFAAPIGGGAEATLVTGFTAPAELVIVGDRLVFSTINDAGVYVMPKAGGERLPLASRGGFGVAADAHHVYFGEYDGRIARVPLEGGAIEVIGISPSTPTDLALTATSVYWAGTTDGLILKVAK